MKNEYPFQSPYSQVLQTAAADEPEGVVSALYCQQSLKHPLFVQNEPAGVESAHYCQRSLKHSLFIHAALGAQISI
jgi:hypothetical protein